MLRHAKAWPRPRFKNLDPSKLPRLFFSKLISPAKTMQRIFVPSTNASSRFAEPVTTSNLSGRENTVSSRKIVARLNKKDLLRTVSYDSRWKNNIGHTFQLFGGPLCEAAGDSQFARSDCSWISTRLRGGSSECSETVRTIQDAGIIGCVRFDRFVRKQK